MLIRWIISQNFVTAITENPDITYRDLYLYHTGPAEFIKR